MSYESLTVLAGVLAGLLAVSLIFLVLTWQVSGYWMRETYSARSDESKARGERDLARASLSKMQQSLTSIARQCKAGGVEFSQVIEIKEPQ